MIEADPAKIKEIFGRARLANLESQMCLWTYYRAPEVTRPAKTGCLTG